MTRKVAVPDTLIILANFALPVKWKKLCGTRCNHQSAYKCSLCSECTLLKRIYEPADAHERAYQAISEARTGILSNEDDIAGINQIISPLVRNGQSLHQIYLEHVDGSCVVKKHYTITLMHNFSISKTSICPAKSNITHVIKKLSLR